ncbi:uncharacterized protein LOC127860194 [Dreissena polymorpha]|uniref:Uncharacterized protein n=1 Tax=Dreissena polymorpha TaxID=45954 RepID=A0A9D4BRT3_DREPO|nr:uncharacterized protein LOC127860194 [Dreissena polymorpha]KAH3702962.1 hypothetical protein DPMN_077990 [Dreissena polymorpha]
MEASTVVEVAVMEAYLEEAVAADEAVVVAPVAVVDIGVKEAEAPASVPITKTVTEAVTLFVRPGASAKMRPVAPGVLEDWTAFGEAEGPLRRRWAKAGGEEPVSSDGSEVRMAKTESQELTDMGEEAETCSQIWAILKCVCNN